MIRNIIIAWLLKASILGFSQAQEPTKVEMQNVDKYFNYFTESNDSVVSIMNGIYLDPRDSIIETFTIQREKSKGNSRFGWLTISHNDKVLYKYELVDGKVDGIGYCYYPFTGRVAFQAQFKKDKLNGIVFFQDMSGKIIEVMKFKSGRYRRHLFHWLSYSKKSLRLRSKNRSSNPLRNDEVITV